MRLASATVFFLLLALTACGQLDPPEQRLAEAPDRTKAADTARMALESTTNMGDPGGSRMNYTVAGEGQVDFAAERMQLTLDMPGPVPGNMEMVVDGDVAYLKMPFAVADGDEARWIETEVGEASTDGMMQSGMAQDPTEALTALGAVEGDIDELGADEVGGEPVHGYAFDVPADEVFAVDDDEAEGLSEVPVAMEAWLDTDGRVRRLSQTVDLAEVMSALDMDSELPEEMGADLSELTGEQTTVIQFFDFGEPVDIEIPPADQVDDQADFDQGLMRDSASSSASGSASSSAPHGVEVEDGSEVSLPVPDAQGGDAYDGTSAEPAPQPQQLEPSEGDSVEREAVEPDAVQPGSATSSDPAPQTTE